MTELAFARVADETAQRGTSGTTATGVASSRTDAAPSLRYGPPGDTTPATVGNSLYGRKQSFRPGLTGKRETA